MPPAPALNAKIAAYNASVTPQSVVADGPPDEACKAIAAERAAYLHKIEQICTRRAQHLYGAGAKKSNRKSKATVKVLVESLPFDEQFYVFGPWAIIQVPAPELDDKCWSPRGYPIRSEIAKRVNAAGRDAEDVVKANVLATWLGSLPF